MKKYYFLLLLSSITIPLLSQNWSALGNGYNLSGAGVNVWSLKCDSAQNVMYLGGCFDSIDGVPSHHIGKWNTFSFSNLGTGMDVGSGYVVLAGEMYNGEYYAGGDFLHADGVLTPHIARWNGTTWDSVGAGTNGWVYCMKEFNGELYVGGTFTMAGGIPVNYLAKWDGNSWSGVGSTLPYPVCDMEIYDGQLYLFGWNKCYFLNGTTLIDMGVSANPNPLGEFGWRGMEVYNGELYVGGLDSAGGNPVNSIARWNGASWSDVGLGLTWNNCNHCAAVGAMSVYNGELYVGGEFSIAGNIPVNNIAKWDGQNWSALGSGMDNIVLSMDVIGNSLIVGGYFTTAGGVPVDRIARWNNITGIPEVATENILIYPSLGNSEFILEGNFPSDTKLEVFDLIGQRVSEIEIPQGNQNFPIPLSLAEGVYIFQVKDGETILKSQKIVIVH